MREFVLTHVILAPGACGREGQSAGSGTISSGSGDEFQICLSPASPPGQPSPAAPTSDISHNGYLGSRAGVTKQDIGSTICAHGLAHVTEKKKCIPDFGLYQTLVYTRLSRPLWCIPDFGVYPPANATLVYSPLSMEGVHRFETKLPLSQQLVVYTKVRYTPKSGIHQTLVYTPNAPKYTPKSGIHQSQGQRRSLYTRVRVYTRNTYERTHSSYTPKSGIHQTVTEKTSGRIHCFHEGRGAWSLCGRVGGWAPGVRQVQPKGALRMTSGAVCVGARGPK